MQHVRMRSVRQAVKLLIYSFCKKGQFWSYIINQNTQQQREDKYLLQYNLGYNKKRLIAINLKSSITQPLPVAILSVRTCTTVGLPFIAVRSTAD
jgi:hypothetical protein